MGDCLISPTQVPSLVFFPAAHRGCVPKDGFTSVSPCFSSGVSLCISVFRVSISFSLSLSLPLSLCLFLRAKQLIFWLNKSLLIESQVLSIAIAGGLPGGINLASFFMQLCSFQHLLPFKGLLPSCRLLGSETQCPTVARASWDLKATLWELKAGCSHPQPTLTTSTSAPSHLLSHLSII